MRRSVCRQLLAATVAVGTAWAGEPNAGPPTPDAWQSLSPEQQVRAREHYQRFQALPAPDRERVHQAYRRWQDLPVEQRQQLRRSYESYQQLDPAEQQRFNREYQTWKAAQESTGPPAGP
jgi:hypothetical protein